MGTGRDMATHVSPVQDRAGKDGIGVIFIGPCLGSLVDNVLYTTLPQSNMETHIAPFQRDCSLYRAPFGFPC